MQGSGGGGHKCCLLLVSSRQVVVVGMNAICHSFWAGSGGGGHECRLPLVSSREVVVEIASPSVSRFEGGREGHSRGVAVVGVGGVFVRFEEGLRGRGVVENLPLRLAFQGREGRSKGVVVLGVSGVFVWFEEGGEWWRGEGKPSSSHRCACKDSQYNEIIHFKKYTNYWEWAWQLIPPSFCCCVIVDVVVVFASLCSLRCVVLSWHGNTVIVGSGGGGGKWTCGCRVRWQMMWCDVTGTHTHTRINPDPWEWVWVSWGLGPGGPKITQGLPVMCTSSLKLLPPPLLLRNHVPARNKYECTPRDPNGTTTATRGRSIIRKWCVTCRRPSTKQTRFAGWELVPALRLQAESMVRTTVDTSTRSRSGKKEMGETETGSRRTALAHCVLWVYDMRRAKINAQSLKMARVACKSTTHHSPLPEYVPDKGQMQELDTLCVEEVLMTSKAPTVSYI